MQLEWSKYPDGSWRSLLVVLDGPNLEGIGVTIVFREKEDAEEPSVVALGQRDIKMATASAKENREVLQHGTPRELKFTSARVDMADLDGVFGFLVCQYPQAIILAGSSGWNKDAQPMPVNLPF